MVSFGLGQYWQYQIRKLMGVTEYNIAFVVISPLVAALIVWLILLIGRGLRRLYRRAAHLLDRYMGGGRQMRSAGSGGRPGLRGSHRPAVHWFRRRGQRCILSTQHDDSEGGAPAHDEPAFGRPRFVHSLANARHGRPQLHRHGSVRERYSEGHRPSGHGTHPGLRRTGVGPECGVPGRPGGQGPGARGRLPAQGPPPGDNDRQRLGRPRPGGLVRVPLRRRLGDRGDPVLLPAVMDFLPGRPVQGARGGRSAVQRGLHPLVAAAPRPSPPAVRGRGKPGVIRRGVGLRRRIRPEPDHWHVVRRAAQFRHAVPGIQRPPRPRQPGGPAGLPGRADRAVHG